MNLELYQRDMEGCSRCASCKWIPFNQIKGERFAKNCPAISKYNFHAYSGSGKMMMGLSMLHGRSELTEKVAEIIYNCQMCGACEASCKVYRDDIDLNDVMLELRSNCVEQGEIVFEHMEMIESLKQEDNPLGEPKKERGLWAEGLSLKDANKEKVEVLFHAGCKYSFDPTLRDIVRGQAQLMISSGVDVGIAGKAEACCGARAYETGFQGESANFADNMMSIVNNCGAKILVTPCADCYSAFRQLYLKMDKKLPCRILHSSQYFEMLIHEKRLTLNTSEELTVTYHDPCHLGRRSEPFLEKWKGDDKLFRPSRLKRSGRFGIYDSPRRLIDALPGVRLVEMERIKTHSWCCGSGAGVLEAYPDFASWTARERISEALSTGADALVTSCPRCINAFQTAAEEMQADIKILELTELVLKAAELSVPANA